MGLQTPTEINYDGMKNRSLRSDGYSVIGPVNCLRQSIFFSLPYVCVLKCEYLLENNSTDDKKYQNCKKKPFII